MIILEVCNFAPDYPGNFISSLKSLEKIALQKNENNRIIYALPERASQKNWVKDLERTNIVCYFPSGIFKQNIALLRICRRYKVDVLHSHFMGAFSMFLLPLFSRVKVIQHFHNTLEYSKKAAFLLRLLSLKFDKFVGCSKAVYDSLLYYNYSKKKCTFITNCIDFKRLDQIVLEHPLDIGYRNLLILGTDFYRKGVDAALKAVELLDNKEDLRLNIISHNEDQTLSLVIKTLGFIPNWVKILSPSSNIGDYYRNVEIFLSPSINEGLCYANMEAIYCGAMVIKTAIPSQVYNLEDEDYITIPTQNELHEKIVSILEMTSEEKKRIIESLRKQIIDPYKIENWGISTYELYESLMK